MGLSKLVGMPGMDPGTCLLAQCFWETERGPEALLKGQGLGQ